MVAVALVNGAVVAAIAGAAEERVVESFVLGWLGAFLAVVVVVDAARGDFSERAGFVVDFYK